MTLQSEILKQIDTVLGMHRDLRSRSQHDDCSDQPREAIAAVTALMCDAIERLAPPNSQFVESMKAILKRSGAGNAYVVPHIAGVLLGLRTAYSAGYLASVTELIHADIFADFIEMADYLLSEGYKDPAAVIIGSTLEEHLRQLCVKHELPTDAAGRPKKADQLNADLASQAVYSKLDQKSITAWLDLRNKAAHGKYGEYTKEQVALVIQSIRDFMTRIPS